MSIDIDFLENKKYKRQEVGHSYDCFYFSAPAKIVCYPCKRDQKRYHLLMVFMIG